MITFRTETNSLYEVDTKNAKVRRVTGAKPATVRMGEQSWKKFMACNDPHVGENVVFVWNIDDKGIAQTTMTSRVISIDMSEGETNEQ
jgi:hypothetical protein